MLEFQEWVVSAISSNIWGYQPIWSIFHYPNAKGLELLIIFHISRRSILDIAYKLSNLSKEIFAFCYLITAICIIAQLRASWLTQLSLDRGKQRISEVTSLQSSVIASKNTQNIWIYDEKVFSNVQHCDMVAVFVAGTRREAWEGFLCFAPWEFVSSPSSWGQWIAFKLQPVICQGRREVFPIKM